MAKRRGAGLMSGLKSLFGLKPKKTKPRIVVTYKKPEVTSETQPQPFCGICLGKIKTGLPMIICGCGKRYHVSCGSRVGECPNCSGEIESQMRVEQERAGKDVIENIPKVRLSEEELLKILDERLVLGEISEEMYRELKAKYERTEEEEVEEFHCPICGKAVGENDAECECGAIFSDEEMRDPFFCPECNTLLDGRMDTCEVCGVRFIEPDSELTCPECGEAIKVDADSCGNCGAVFDGLVEGFKCPACGEFQKLDAKTCSSCGAIYADVDKRIFICPECGMTVEEGDATCRNCKAIFEE